MQDCEMMQKKRYSKILGSSRGFTLLEVLLGVTVFMIGMLGVTALNISSLKSNTYSGNLSEATMIAADKVEELMGLELTNDPATTDPLLLDADDDGGQATDQDVDKDGLDDDDPEDTDAAAVDGIQNFGLDDNTAATVDHIDDNGGAGWGKNGMYTIYHNIAEGEPFDYCKRINVIVRWSMKDVPRQINMNTVRCREM